MQSYPFTSQVTYDEQGLPLYDRAVNSEFLRDVFKQYFSDGVFYSGNSACLQVAADTGMQVKVSPGACHIQGAMGIEYYQRTLVVQAAGAQDRIDTVVARLDLSVDARKIDLYVRQGTPGESPSAPALTRDSTTWELGLANLFIAKNTSRISKERITDTRLDTDRCGMVAAAVQPPFDTEEFFAQLNAAIAAHQQAADDQIADINSEWDAQQGSINSDYASWKAQTQADYNQWFNQIKGNLDDDPAGQLAKEVAELQNRDDVISTYQHVKTGTEHLFIGSGSNGKVKMRADIASGDAVVISSAPKNKVTVQGETSQPGTGDPSPDNIRMIDGIGVYDQCVVLDGSESWYSFGNIPGVFYTDISVDIKFIYSTIIKTSSKKYAHYDSMASLKLSEFDVQLPAGEIRFVVRVDNSSTSSQIAKDYFSLHPLTVWIRSIDFYKSKGPFYYVHEVSDGSTSPYKAIGIELNAPLFDGDSLEIGGLGGFYQMIVCDGNEFTGGNPTVSWSYSLPSYTNYDRITGVVASNYFASTGGNISYESPINTVGINSEGRLIIKSDKFADDYEALNAWIAEMHSAGHPLIVFYRSVNYTPENDIPVALESYKSFYKTFDGTEEFTLAYSGEDANEYDLVLNGAGTILNTSSDDNASCSHFKKGNFTVDGNWQATSMSNDVTIQFFRSKTDCPDVNSFKQWLQEEYENGTPVQCVMNFTTAVKYAHLAQPESLPAYYGVEDFVDALAGEDVEGKWLSFTNDGRQLNFKGGGGLSSSKLAAADAELGDVRTGKKFYAGDKEVKTGTLPVHNVSIGSYIDFWTNSSNGQKYIDINKIPEGIYESTGAEYSPQVRAPAELFGNAADSQVLAGVTFTSQNGAKIPGTMPNQGAKTAALNAGGSYTIPAGYHNGSGKVTANSLASQTDANAAAGNILTGKTAWVKGSKITGTMANRGAPNKMLGIGESYRLSAGYYSGGELIAKGSFSGSGSSGDKSGSYAEIYRNESNVTREIQARSYASASISGKTVTITVHAEAYQRANDIPSLSGTKSSVDYSFSFTIS